MAKTKVTEEQVHDAVKVILSDKEHYATSLNWAVNYAQASVGMNGHELEVQALYIVNNLANWRHPEAANVRKVLRGFGNRTF